jgi:hypothetical protein
MARGQPLTGLGRDWARTSSVGCTYGYSRLPPPGPHQSHFCLGARCPELRQVGPSGLATVQTLSGVLGTRRPGVNSQNGKALRNCTLFGLPLDSAFILTA